MLRFLSILISTAALLSCGPATLPPTDRPEVRPIAGIVAADPAVPADTRAARSTTTPRPPRPEVALRVHQVQPGGLQVTALTYDARQHHLRVVDNADGPGTGAGSARQAAASRGGIAAINGGFFTPEGQPLGLVFEDGKRYGNLSSSSLGSGLFVQLADRGLPVLTRRGDRTNLSKARHLLQSGPFLVEDGRAVSGLSSSRPRARSFLLWDGGVGWALGHSSSTSLSALARALARQPLPDFTIHHALNLDGGTSSDLWVSPGVDGGPVSTRRLWNKKVRNYLVLTSARR